MSQVPHITDQNCTDAFKALQDKGFYSIADLCNKANEMALAEQATEQYITAKEARKLGAGKAEYESHNGEWLKLDPDFYAHKNVCDDLLKYRAIKQPEPEKSTNFEYDGHKNYSNTEPVDSHLYPKMHDESEAKAALKTAVEPHAELKAMYEQQVKNTAEGKAGGLEDFTWECRAPVTAWFTLGDEKPPQFHKGHEYRCTPKPTCQVKNLDTGELKTMTREAAKLLQAETKDTCDWMQPKQKSMVNVSASLAWQKGGC